MSFTSQKFGLFHVANFSVQNLRSFLLMEQGYLMDIMQGKNE